MESETKTMQQSQKYSQLDSMQHQHTLLIHNTPQVVGRDKTERSKVSVSSLFFSLVPPKSAASFCLTGI